ncbi:hypothetical protein P5673_004595 [Acropora cervicornis]|uniref:Uncharacterized protein n=1 Tax=Acropora cervicornis TaxID=6130 RepID=A0AAD9R0G8_ACRCE|nr:hypothetical protein P5673_004595 [Acropora cervicornis]
MALHLSLIEYPAVDNQKSLQSASKDMTSKVLNIIRASCLGCSRNGIIVFGATRLYLKIRGLADHFGQSLIGNEGSVFTELDHSEIMLVLSEEIEDFGFQEVLFTSADIDNLGCVTGPEFSLQKILSWFILNPQDFYVANFSWKTRNTGFLNVGHKPLFIHKIIQFKRRQLSFL